MKKGQRKDKKPCTQLTERALENLARLIISELENTDISRGIRNRKEDSLPQKASWFSEHENTFHCSRPVCGE